MEIFNPPDLTVQVVQYDLLTGDWNRVFCELVLLKNKFEFNILNNEQLPSLSLETSNYRLLVVYKTDTTDKIWEFKLEVTDLETNDFTIKHNDGSIGLLHFINKFKLHDKLLVNLNDTDLTIHKFKDSNKSKI